MFNWFHFENYMSKFKVRILGHFTVKMKVPAEKNHILYRIFNKMKYAFERGEKKLEKLYQWFKKKNQLAIFKDFLKV